MANIRSDALDAYNPFEADSEQGSTPAVLRHSEDYRPNSAAGANSFSSTTNNNSARQMEIERREAELAAKEEELARRESDIANQATGRAANEPNWPPLPRFLPCRPCIRVDFENDFNSATRLMARMSHYFWVTYSLVLFVNVFGTMTNMIVDKGNSVAGALFGTSILLAVLLPLFGFFCWNRPLYKALKSDSSLNFFVFFLCFAVQCILLGIQALGIDYLGSCGWINGIRVVNMNKAAGAFMLALAVCFTLLCGAGCFLVIKVHRHFRNTDGSMTRAKAEAAQSAGRTLIQQP